jgi:hypothetical protein
LLTIGVQVSLMGIKEKALARNRFQLVEFCEGALRSGSLEIQTKLVAIKKYTGIGLMWWHLVAVAICIIKDSIDIERPSINTISSGDI